MTAPEQSFLSAEALSSAPGPLRTLDILDKILRHLVNSLHLVLEHDMERRSWQKVREIDALCLLKNVHLLHQKQLIFAPRALCRHRLQCESCHGRSGHPDTHQTHPSLISSLVKYRHA
jgi:hypothetical protein